MLSSEDDVVAPLQVLVSDSDEIMVRLLAADLRRQDKFLVAECPIDPSKIISVLAESRPAILVLGLRAREPVADAIALLRRVYSLCPALRTIVLSEETESDLVLNLFRARIRGFFERGIYDPALLSRCIECVAKGQIWVRSEHLDCVMEAFARAPVCEDRKSLPVLTPRELDVAQAVCDGLSNFEVARRLGLSIHTVKNYLFNVFDKVGVSNRAELILYMVSHAAPDERSGSSIEVRRAPKRSRATRSTRNVTKANAPSSIRRNRIVA